jgi:type IV secretion system protein TrbB
MRYRPDRIVVGEVRGGECLELLKAWNTGHPGGVATVHANDALSGLIRLENLVAEETPAPMQKTIAAAIDLIAVIAKTKIEVCKAGRQVQELLRVQGHDGRNYVTQIME